MKQAHLHPVDKAAVGALCCPVSRAAFVSSGTVKAARPLPRGIANAASMKPSTLIVLNLAAFATFAPGLILGPNLAHGLPILWGHWLALIIGFASALALLALSIRRECLARREAAQRAARAARERVLNDIIAAAKADAPVAAPSPFAQAAD